MGSAESECARLMIGAYRCADVHDVEGFLSLFSEDATFTRLGPIITGKDALRAFMESRSARRVTRHVLSPPWISVESEDSATGVGLFTLYEGQDTGEPGPLPLTAPVVLGEFHQTYRRTSLGWLITSDTVRGIFRQASKQA